MLKGKERPEIPEMKTRELFPLTHAQKRIWYTDKINENSSISIIAFFIRFKERKDIGLLQKAINIMLKKNDGLRLRFLENENRGPVQYVSNYSEKQLEIVDFSLDRNSAGLKKWLRENAGKPFEQMNDNLFQFVFVKMPEAKSGLFVKTHHIISDGWTCVLIANEIINTYKSLKNEEPVIIEANPSYLDYIEEEKIFLRSPESEASRNYWLEKLKNPPDLVDIVFSGKKSKSLKAQTKTFEFSPGLRKNIHKYIDNYRSSRYSVLLTAFSLYLSKATGLDKVTVAGFSHNRANRRQMQMMGMFVSSFPMIIDIDHSLGFRDLEKNVGRGELRNTLRHGAKYPFDLIVPEIKQKTGFDASKLLAYNIVGHPDIYEEDSVEYLFSGEDDAILSIHENVENTDIKGVMKLTFNYRGDLFDEEEIATIFRSIENILEEAMLAPEKPLSSISMVQKEEKEKILHCFNQTEADFPKDKTLNRLFEEQVKKTPQKTALVFKNTKLTYEGLNKKANQLAQNLRKLGVKKDQIVAILADRSANIIVGMLAVLKAGGAYTPVDPEYPSERIKYILEDSGAKILLTNNDLEKKANFKHRTIRLDDETAYQETGENLNPVNTPDSLAYIIYTSGSTGRPKGVMIEHHSVVNYISWHKNYYNINESYKCAAHSSFSFDASVPQIYSPLLSGAELHIIDSDIRLSPVELNDYFENHNINHADLPTQFAEQFMTTVRNNSLKSITTGGEKLSQYRVQNYKLVDEYGPTEYTVTATYFHIDGFYEKTPIGKPVNNTIAYILDKYDNIQPVGIPGELCLAGEGLARGYLGKPELTDEKFTQSPFVSGTKIYRTGDIARWLPDGNIDFIGRKDFQVKIRGFRIEPGEIENALRQIKGIKDSVVLHNTAEGENTFLSAHIVLNNSTIAIKDKEYRVLTCAQDPALKEKMETQHIGSWQKFFQGNKVNNIYWEKLYRSFPDYQFAVLNADNEVTALGNLIPLYWSGKNEDLPAGWDEAVVKGFEDMKNGVPPNTVCALAGVVNPKFKHSGLSYEIIKIMDKIVTANGIDKFILPVRPTLKEKYPLINLEMYASMKNNEGKTLDNWIRVHEKLGGKIIGFCPKSQYIEGSVSQWEEWTGQKFESSGEYVVKGAMNPVSIDIENNKGTYYDPAIWFRHEPSKFLDPPLNTLSPEKIKKCLADYLPDYMVPSKYSFIAKIPVNANGKIDTDALRKSIPAFDDQVEYIGPSTDNEKLLADIWKSIFNIDRIGIHDNFFSLGGDSIISIQMVSRAREAGLDLSVKQLYAYPTIASLAIVANKRTADLAEQKPAEGEAGLTPIQKWFFELDLAEPSYFNQTFLFELSSIIDIKQLQIIFKTIVEHHDSFRLRYKNLDNRMPVQFYSDKGGDYCIETFDVSNMINIDRTAFIEAKCSEIQGKLNIETGPMMNVALFNCGNNEQQRLMIAVHHLIIDMVSWRILLEDFENLYIQIKENIDLQLPYKTSSYRSWHEGLEKYAKTASVASQKDYWLNVGKNASPFPFDFQTDSYTMKEIDRFDFSIDPELTDQLLSRTPPVYHTRINDNLLSALMIAYRNWSGNCDLLIEMEGHGREECIGRYDLSRTIGWFTTLFPVHLKLNHSSSNEISDNYIARTIKSIKEQLRKIPNNGIGYGVLRYLSDGKAEGLKAGQRPALSFNYLGQMNEGRSGLFLQAKEKPGPMVGPANAGIHPMEIDCIVSGGMLKFQISYSNKHFKKESVADFSENIKSALKMIIEHSLKPESGGFTPSDFPLASIDQQTIDILTEGKEIESIYNLSPLQEGLLFHSILSKNSSEYVNQTYWTIEGSLNLDAYKKAWYELINNHSIFRTAFIWQNMQKPLQIVYKKVDLPWNYLDWRKYSADAQAKKFSELLSADKKQGFDISTPCLTRLYLISLKEDIHKFIWTDHHILTDGWCVPLLFSELLERYSCHIENRKLTIPKPPEYINYISWLQERDQKEAESFWKTYLEGVEKPTIPRFSKTRSLDIHATTENFRQISTVLPEKLSEDCQAYAHKNRITINSVIQTAWATLLSAYSQDKDIVMGTVVSGRPDKLPEVEKMIGLFINSLPVRIKIDDNTTSAEQIKKTQLDIQKIGEFSYLSISDIQEYTAIPSKLPLFYTLFVFENYPFDQHSIKTHDITIKDIHSIENANLPLSLIVFPGPRITLKAAYNEDYFESKVIAEVMDDLQLMLKTIIENPDKTLNEVIEKFEDCTYSNILQAGENEYYSCTPIQKKIFFQEQLPGIATANNLTYAIEISGNLDLERLSKCLDQLVSENSLLRTSFATIDGIPVQIINKDVHLKKIYQEINSDNTGPIVKDFITPFSLDKAPLIRTKLIKSKNDQFLLIVDLHRIICDEHSAGLIVNRLFDLYSGCLKAASPLQYIDFASWLSKASKSNQFRMTEKYWLGRFSEEIPVLDIIPDRGLSRQTLFEAGSKDIEVETIEEHKIQKTAFTDILATAVSILLHRFTGQDDIIVGISTNGRNRPETALITGQFENILPIRSNPDGEKTVQHYLEELKLQIAEAFENKSYPIDLLYEKLSLSRESQRDPLFDIVLKYGSTKAIEFNVDGLQIKASPFDRNISKYYLMFETFEYGPKIKMRYRKDVFSDETAERIANYLKNIIKQILTNRDVKISEVDFIPEKEKLLLMHGFNNTMKDYNIDLTVNELFEEIADRFPDNKALVFEDECLTYSELNKKANQLARLLRKKGVVRDSLVGVFLGPSLEMIIGIMGVLKAGGAYIPIDASYPKERLEYMLSDSNARILLTQKTLVKNIDYNGEIILLDNKEIYSEDGSNPKNISQPTDLAYIIYTSGSTGKPKGTMIEHRSLVNLIKWKIETKEIIELDNVCKFASFGFDASVIEIFPCLMAGATLHIIPDELKLSIADLNRYFEKNNISVSIMPTQFGEQFIALSENHSLRALTLGGDELKNYKKTNFNLYNGYGPTEYTVCTTDFLVDGHYEKLPIGKPIYNTRLYIVDKNNNIKPIGTAGELCISGAGLSRGYLNRPDLTKEKFIDNPFEKGKKMYKTGDNARWLPDGNLEFLGRIDHQVKIRGFRVEMGEIEQTLIKHPSITDSVVVAKADEFGNKFLCGYYASKTDIPNDELTRFLKSYLPDYMVPQYLVRLEELPLTPNGKVDRKSLPDPETSKERRDIILEPSSKNEIEIANAWKTVLGIDRISINDNFFDLGGHSIKAVTLTAMLQKQYEITVADIFKYQTIRELAKNIRENRDYLKLKLDSAKKFFSKISKTGMPKSSEIEKEQIEYEKKNKIYEQIELKNTKKYECILLAGSTGFRGVFLLRELLLEKESHIYLPIRGYDHKESEEKLKDRVTHYFGEGFYDKYKSRITVIPADLLKENFGLPEHEYKELADRTECVFQSSAYLKHYGNFDDYYNGNIATTQTLLKFARTGKQKDFNLISTISIAEGKVSNAPRGLFSEYDLDIGQKAENTYAQTRFEAEKLANQAREEGLNVNIFRLGLVTLDYDGGVLQKNIEDTVFFQKLKAYINLGIIPDYLDSEPATFADYSAKAIVLLFDRTDLMNENHHIINSNDLKLSEILTDPGYAANTEKLDIGTFIEKLEFYYKSENLKKYVEMLMLHWGLLSDIPFEELFMMAPQIATGRTNLILEKLGFKWPDFESAKIRSLALKSLEARTRFLSSISIFAGLSNNIIEELAFLAKAEVYFEDEEILYEGQSNSRLFLIQSGSVSASRHSSSGWLGTIRILGKGHIFGEESIAGNNKSSLLLETVFGESVVLTFRSKDILDLIKKYPDLNTRLISYLCGKINVLESLIVNLG